jgi:CBS domain-containing protein
MAVIDKRNVLRGLQVRDAMRRQFIHRPPSASIQRAIRAMIKFKMDAVLVTDHRLRPEGLVSQTDLMGAYYGGIPVTQPLSSVMIGPPVVCYHDTPLETALETMQSNRIHQIYVLGDQYDQVMGVLTYPDIVGMLYRFCSKCRWNIRRRRKGPGPEEPVQHLLVRDVMTPAVQSYHQRDPLETVMEGLAAQGFGAALIRDNSEAPTGVVSKTDLTLAYLRGRPLDTPAGDVMNAPVRSCDRTAPLEEALQQMIFSDVLRLFVHVNHPADIVGVFTLSDAARARSGSCRACTPSRIEI